MAVIKHQTKANYRREDLFGLIQRDQSPSWEGIVTAGSGHKTAESSYLEPHVGHREHIGNSMKL